MADILVVDDDYALAEMFKDVLQDAGHQVRHAPEGGSALSMARQKKPQLVLLDVMMPGMNGFEVCRRLRADPLLKDVKIIMVTALNQAGDAERAFACGANDYLMKPVELKRLLYKVDRALKPGPSAPP